MLTIRKPQWKEFSSDDSIHRLRLYLYDSFPDTKEMPTHEFDAAIRDLVSKARTFGLSTELEVAPFLAGSWLMGIGFEEQFSFVYDKLSSPDLSSDEKTEFLWEFFKESFETLQGS